jgi:hypothetical protein
VGYSEKSTVQARDKARRFFEELAKKWPSRIATGEFFACESYQTIGKRQSAPISDGRRQIWGVDISALLQEVREEEARRKGGD